MRWNTHNTKTHVKLGQGESMTDQTRWGIDLIHTKNKAIKRQKDIINRAILEVDKLEEQYIVELMMEIEAIYERKYGNNEAKNTKHKIL